MTLNKKTVFLTGANGGIGEKIIIELLKHDVAKIYAAARNSALLEKICAMDANKIIPVRLDITDENAVRKVADEYRDVDILINNAGVNTGKWITAPDALEAARMEMEINYFGTFMMCTAFAPKLIQKGGGTIVNICSLLSFVSMPANGTYCASKAALFSLTQSLRGELATQGVQVIGVYPGPVDTRLTAGLDVPKILPDEVAREVVNAILAGAYRVLPGAEAKETYAAMLQDYEKVEHEMGKIVPQ